MRFLEIFREALSDLEIKLGPYLEEFEEQRSVTNADGVAGYIIVSSTFVRRGTVAEIASLLGEFESFKADLQRSYDIHHNIRSDDGSSKSKKDMEVDIQIEKWINRVNGFIRSLDSYIAPLFRNQNVPDTLINHGLDNEQEVSEILEVMSYMGYYESRDWLKEIVRCLKNEDADREALSVNYLARVDGSWSGYYGTAEQLERIKQYAEELPLGRRVVYLDTTLRHMNKLLDEAKIFSRIAENWKDDHGSADQLEEIRTSAYHLPRARSIAYLQNILRQMEQQDEQQAGIEQIEQELVQDIAEDTAEEEGDPIQDLAGVEGILFEADFDDLMDINENDMIALAGQDDGSAGPAEMLCGPHEASY